MIMCQSPACDSQKYATKVSHFAHLIISLAFFLKNLVNESGIGVNPKIKSQ